MTLHHANSFPQWLDLPTILTAMARAGAIGANLGGLALSISCRQSRGRAPLLRASAFQAAKAHNQLYLIVSMGADWQLKAQLWHAFLSVKRPYLKDVSSDYRGKTWLSFKYFYLVALS
jgi:hypothetical protein